ncbi:diguanylate cyclase [Actinomyces ruminicola]|uniref:Aerotaxis receptor n=1 Tax=Actinomyces ruminicola TaxID=332524 RepID=A0A1G9V9C4_9ACTO|nr:diguanylate cyclase [Actinomyces ruminicola]SDM68792.1 aerotaxis receptor [Actinomyces ruminicola]
MESQIGYERMFDPEDIFFSTTDSKGVIQNTNRTFDTLSRYSRDRLIGSAHNIIRHLDMPAGLFRLMWDDLQKGRPVCAYVTNRALDGLDYRVFATIVPLREGYLSVRIKPMDTATRAQVEKAYRRVRDAERELAAHAASRRRIGEQGAVELAKELEGFGFGSLHEMTRVMLPREVAALVSVGVRVPAVTSAALGPVARILDSAAMIEKKTDALVYELDEYMRLIVAMESASSAILAAQRRAVRIGRLVSRDMGGGDRDRAQVLVGQILDLIGTADAELGVLPVRLRAMHEAVTELRFAVALMRLLTLMVGRFAQSILDGSEEEPVRSLRDLHEALESGFAGLAPALRAVGAQAAELDDSLHTITSSLDRVTRRLGRWVDVRTGGFLGSRTVNELASLASQGFPEVRSFAQLAAECRGLSLVYDDAATERRLAAARDSLAELS